MAVFVSGLVRLQKTTRYFPLRRLFLQVLGRTGPLFFLLCSLTILVSSLYRSVIGRSLPILA